MDANLFISEILFAIISTISLSVAWQFYRTRNGQLRKIMIALFTVDGLVYIVSGFYFWLMYMKYTEIGIGTFRMIVLVPKALCMLVLLNYLNKQKTN